MNQYINFLRSNDVIFKESGDELILEFCPFCDKDNFHFYMNKDSGLFNCKRCGESGNFFDLRKQFKGTSMSAEPVKVISTEIHLPLTVNVNKFQKTLWEDEDAIDYILVERGWREDVVRSMQIGLDIDSDGKKWLAIPHIKHGEIRSIKYRSIPPYLDPPGKREFKFTSGGSTQLYNQDCISSGMEDLIFLEGEGDVIALLSAGYPNRAVGLPGKDVGKSEWVTRIDESNIGKIYFCFDNEKDSQKSAKALAKRIGLNKVYNIVLPEFQLKNGKRGKDINEWLCEGHTLEEFEELKFKAEKFNVDGIRSSIQIIEELEELAKSGTLALPEFDSPWLSVNRLLGGFDRGNSVGITAPAKIGKTVTALNWLKYFSNDKDIPSFMFCQEMRDTRLMQQWISMVTQTPVGPMKPLPLSSIVQAKDIALKSKAPLLFGYTTWKHTDEIFETIYQAYRRYGAVVTCFDNLHFLSRDMKNTTQEISILSKKFKDLAMELDILMMTILQPTKLNEGEVASIYHSRGAAALVQDLDVGISLHRNRRTKLTEEIFAASGFVDQEDAYEPQMLFIAGATRCAPGGVTTLMFNGATSTVSDFPEYEMEKAMKAINRMNEIAPTQL